MKRLVALLALFLLICAPSFAAISASTVWEVRTAGADTNGGGFVATGTDMSIFDNKNAAACTSCQSATVNISTTDGVTAGTTTITSVTGNYSSALIGNIVYITGGTGSVAAAWYQVLTVPGTTSFTVDRSTGLTTGTGVTINIGGALLTPGQASANAIAGNIVYLKYNATPFAITTNSSGAAGPLNSAVSVLFQSYDSTRTLLNTNANQAIVQTQASSVTAVAGNGSAQFIGIVFDGNSQTSSKFVANTAVFYKVTAKNFNTASSGSLNTCVQCIFTTNSASATTGSCIYCEAYANTSSQFTTMVTCVFCLSYGNTGGSTEGFTMAAAPSVCVHCTAYNNGQDGFSSIFVSSALLLDVHSESNARYGYNLSNNSKLVDYYGSFSNGTAATNTANTFGLGTAFSLSGSAFVSAGSNDFGLNSTASAGATLRNAAYPTTFPRGTTNTYMDVGAARHQDPAGGGATVGYPLSQ